MQIGSRSAFANPFVIPTPGYADAGAGLLDGRAVFGWFLAAAPSASLGWLAKRAIDVVGAALLLILVSPLLLAAIVLVRLTSRGPAVFAQERPGYRGRSFRMYKLRTMVEGAGALEARLGERGGRGVFFKLESDPRVTPIGRLLRRTSVDELPQLVNVLRGEMSLVGPRPLLAGDVTNLPPAADRLRFTMLPGMTGLWQVSGRSRSTEQDRLRLDREYVERWSLWLDLKILLRTLPAVVSGSGAV